MQCENKSFSRSLAELPAVILAGGKGTRLRPFTVNFPKPLVPLGDKPIVDILIENLRKEGITDITLSVGHLAELIKAYFFNRKTLELKFLDEIAPTGTAGCLALLPEFTKSLLVMNGDLLTDLSFASFYDFHVQRGAVMTVASHARRVKVDFGVIESDQDDYIINYIEKPEHVSWVSMGAYIYDPRVLKYVAKGEKIDVPELVLRLLRAGEKIAVFKTSGFWLDIGRPDDYARAQEIYDRQNQSDDVVV